MSWGGEEKALSVCVPDLSSWEKQTGIRNTNNSKRDSTGAYIQVTQIWLGKKHISLEGCMFPKPHLSLSFAGQMSPQQALKGG